MCPLFRSIVSLLLLAFLLGLPVHAKPGPLKKTDATAVQLTAELEQQQVIARKVQELLFQGRYDMAQREIEQFMVRWPGNITGYFGMMVLYQLRNFENFDARFDELYQPWHDPGRKRAKEIFKDRDARTWDLFIAGGVLAVSGLQQFNAGNTFRALRDGLTAIQALKRALHKAPDWVDPHYGLGMYNYWRSVFTNRWTFLPFFPDRRAQGIEAIKQAVASGIYVGELAQASLSWIYYNEEKYAEAHQLNEPLLKKYPDNIILRLLKGHISGKLKRYEQAHREYERVLKSNSELTKVYFYIARRTAPST